jgi:serine/threonine-protein kinase RIO1
MSPSSKAPGALQTRGVCRLGLKEANSSQSTSNISYTIFRTSLICERGAKRYVSSRWHFPDISRRILNATQTVEGWFQLEHRQLAYLGE